MSNAFMAQLPFVGKTTTMGWEDDAVAQCYMDHLLQRARVLLPRRGWRVGVLKEFYPRGASLLGLNVNRGSEVCVRFRVPGRKREFLPFHEVLCTTLHEFAHCVHSRHDTSFWNLYYDLVRECEALEVEMIAQGKPLYPVIPAAISSSTASSGHRATVANGKRSTPIAGRGSSTQVLRVGGRRVKAPNEATKKANVFPGKGQRLGGVVLLGSNLETLARDALRQILATAAERRLSKLRAEAPPISPTQSSKIEGAEDENEDLIPDRIPPSRLAEQEKKAFPCLRCGFSNPMDSTECEYCGDLPNDGDDDITTVSKGSAVINSAASIFVGITPNSNSNENIEVNRGNCRENAIAISDDD